MTFLWTSVKGQNFSLGDVLGFEYLHILQSLYKSGAKPLSRTFGARPYGPFFLRSQGLNHIVHSGEGG
uniref:Uncharacterized protein n=1 Tax=Lepeophtheirus salmonis TaxID=72036 RepID=A0A0K2UBN3_LEPSM